MRIKLLVTLTVFCSMAVAASSMGSVSNNLLFGANLLVKLMWAACVITGIALIAAAFTQFQIHRYNPKLVPLMTPVLYLVFGVSAVALPFLERIFAKEDAYEMQDQTVDYPYEDNYINGNDVDDPY